MEASFRRQFLQCRRFREQDEKPLNQTTDLEKVKSALPALRKSKGCILLTSSGASLNGYTSWGAYGASKAALNHLAVTLSVEEPDVTSIAVRPGVVDTQMQKDVREKHSAMRDTDTAQFRDLYKEGKLLRPDQPGNVMAKLVLNGPSTLSGKFLR